MSALFKIFERGDQENTEKRIKATLPAFEIGGIIEFPDNFTEYVKDNFGGRSYFVSLNNRIKKGIFNLDNKHVAYGANGWLFYKGPMLALYNNPVPLTEEELKRIATIQMERKEWLKLHDMDYYLFLPPMSHGIYSEYLPSTFKKAYSQTRREQVIDYLKKHTDVKIILVDNILLNSKEKHQLYYKGDSHWNYYGGFYAYQYLIDYFRNIYPNIPPKLNEDAFNITVEEDKCGDLYDIMNIPKPENRQDTVFRLKNPCYKVIVDSIFKVTELYIHRSINRCDTTLPNLFVYRDSYAKYFLQHLSFHFNKAVFVWDNNFYPKLTLKSGCKIVLFEVAGTPHDALGQGKPNRT